MKKISLIAFGFMMLAGAVNAQSAKEMLESLPKAMPTDEEIVTALNSGKNFVNELKALDAIKNKYDEAVNKYVDECNDSASIADDFNTSDPQALLKNMEKMQARLDAGEQFDAALNSFKENVVFKTSNSSLGFDNYEASGDDQLSEQYAEKRCNVNQDKTDYNDHVATLAAVNKYRKELFALECEEKSIKMKKRLAFLRDYFNVIKANEKQIVEMDEKTMEYNKSLDMKNVVETEPRKLLIQFIERLQTTLSDVPQPIEQYSTWDDYMGNNKG